MTEGRTGATSLLRRRPAFARLWLAELISPLGDAMAMTALILHVIEETGSGKAVALLFLVETLPPLAGPIIGAVADRHPRRAVLVVTSLLQAAVVVAIAPTPTLPLLLALVFLRGLLATVFQAAAGSVVPDLVEDDELPATNALVSAGRESGSMIGPPLAGVLVASMGTASVLAFDALTFLIAAALLAGLPRLKMQREKSRLRADVGEGLAAVFGDRLVRTLTIGFWVLVLSAGDDITLPFLAIRDFGAGPAATGVLLAGASVGLLLGFALVGRGGVPATTTTVVVGMAMMALGNLLTAAAPVLAVAVVTQALRGVGTAIFEPALRTLVQRRLRGPTLGRAMANVYAGVGTAAAAGYAVTGPLLDATSPRVVFVLIGVSGLAVSSAVALGVRGVTVD